MTLEEVFQVVRREPFKPFRIQMSTRESFAVTEPHQVILAKTNMLVGVGGLKGQRLFETIEHCDYSYITQLEEMPEANTTPLIAEVRRRLAARPFVPFIVVMSSGRRHRVPTAKHVSLGPGGERPVVWFDDGSHAMLSARDIISVETVRKRKAKRR